MFASVSGDICVCVLINPLLPGFNTFCMLRLTTLPSNHILVSLHRRQEQQVVWAIGILQSGKVCVRVCARVHVHVHVGVGGEDQESIILPR